MFICDSTCIKKYLNRGAARSFGKCEICGQVDNCHSVPSGQLELAPVIEINLDDILGPIDG